MNGGEFAKALRHFIIMVVVAAIAATVVVHVAARLIERAEREARQFPIAMEEAEARALAGDAMYDCGSRGCGD